MLVDDELYETVQGETWDQIAYNVYGDERLAGFLMEENYDLLDILVFSAGTLVYVPEIEEEETEEEPPWINEDDEEDEGEDYDPYDDWEEDEDELESED